MADKEYTDLPCARTINNILKRNGVITQEASDAATPYQRFEKDQPNEMWQADYKGHIGMRNSARCHPLNIIDDCSRFNLCCEAQGSETFLEIQPVMVRIFREYGLPFSFLCDNGNPWGTAQSPGFSRFEVWLMELGILTLHGRARHPQTQGKEESFNRSMTREFLRYASFADLEDAQRQFDQYRDFYNNERPHHALGLDTPSQHYHRSERPYPEQIAEWEYPEGCQIRRVKINGCFKWRGQLYFLSEAFHGKSIAIRESHIPDHVNLYFRQFRIGRLDLRTNTFVFKRAYRIEDDPRLDGRNPS